MTPAGGGRAVSKAHLVPGGDFAGTVHSVFATACNLAVGGRLVTVHDAAAPHTPTSVRVESSGTGAWAPNARVGDPVRCQDGVLTFGGHALDLRRLPVWAPGHASDPVDATAIARAADAVAAAHDAHLDGRAFPAPGLDERAAELLAALCELAQTKPSPRTTQTSEAARSERTTHTTSPGHTEETAQAVDVAVRRLIGFGPGLTPAGDDLLVGLMATLHRLQHRLDGGPAVPMWVGHALRVVGRAVRREARRTTDVSAHYLRLAADGEFGEAITRLLDALAAGAPRTTVTARAQDVLRMGASSGADAVAGVLLGVRVLVPSPHQKAA